MTVAAGRTGIEAASTGWSLSDVAGTAATVPKRTRGLAAGPDQKRSSIVARSSLASISPV